MVKSIGDRVKNVFKKLEDTFLGVRVRKRDQSDAERSAPSRTVRKQRLAILESKISAASAI